MKKSDTQTIIFILIVLALLCFYCFLLYKVNNIEKLIEIENGIKVSQELGDFKDFADRNVEVYGIITTSLVTITIFIFGLIGYGYWHRSVITIREELSTSIDKYWGTKSQLQNDLILELLERNHYTNHDLSYVLLKNNLPKQALKSGLISLKILAETYKLSESKNLLKIIENQISLYTDDKYFIQQFSKTELQFVQRQLESFNKLPNIDNFKSKLKEIVDKIIIDNSLNSDI